MLKSRPYFDFGKSGFTLVEVIVAVGAMSVGALGLMQLMASQLQAQAKSSAKGNFGQAVSYVDSVMSNDSSCKAALGLPIAFSPQPLGLTDKNGSPQNSQPITIFTSNNGNQGVPYLSVNPPGNQLGSLTVTNVSILYDNGTAFTQPVSGSATQYIINAHIYLAAGNTFNHLNLVNQVTGLNLQVDTSSNQITSCSGFRLGNGSSVNVPNCQPGQLVKANGTSFTCVNAGCPTGYHQSNSTSDVGYIAAGGTIPGFGVLGVACAPGSNQGICSFGAPYIHPTSCTGSNTATGQETGICSDLKGNIIQNPGQVGGWYCSPNCSGLTRNVTYNYCPLQPQSPSSWGTPTQKGSGHTQADCTGAGGWVTSWPQQWNQNQCRITGNGCPAGWQWTGYSQTENGHSGCWSGCGSCDSGSHSWSYNLGVESCCGCLGCICGSGNAWISSLGCF